MYPLYSRNETRRVVHIHNETCTGPQHNGLPSLLPHQLSSFRVIIHVFILVLVNHPLISHTHIKLPLTAARSSLRL